MDSATSFLRSDTLLYVLCGGLLLLLILYILNCIKLNKIKKNYSTFLKKIGNGANLEDMLRKYMNKVEEVNLKNQELISYCNRLDTDMIACLQKVGIVRYSAFKDVGSDLSFALAILDETNTGVVLNGIYSAEASNIYAKPVVSGKSTYTLSEEEQEAIDKAIHSEKTHKVRE